VGWEEVLVVWVKRWGREEQLVVWMKSWGQEEVLVEWMKSLGTGGSAEGVVDCHTTFQSYCLGFDC